MKKESNPDEEEYKRAVKALRHGGGAGNGAPSNPFQEIAQKSRAGGAKEMSPRGDRASRGRGKRGRGGGRR